MKYRKKPVEIEAFQLTSDYDQTFPRWFIDALISAKINEHKGVDGKVYFVIDTLEGCLKVDVGDWIIKGVKGEIYPCKPDIFALTYDPVDDKVVMNP